MHEPAAAPSPYENARRALHRARYDSLRWSALSAVERVARLASLRRALVSNVRALSLADGALTETHVLERCCTELLPLATLLVPEGDDATRGQAGPGVLVVVSHSRDGLRLPLGVALQAVASGLGVVVLYLDRAPVAASRLASMAREAGLPEWLLTVCEEHEGVWLRGLLDAQPQPCVVTDAARALVHRRRPETQRLALGHRRGTAYVDGALSTDAVRAVAASLAQALVLDGADNRLAPGVVYAHAEVLDTFAEELCAVLESELARGRAYAGTLDDALFATARWDEAQFALGECESLTGEGAPGPAVLLGAEALAQGLLALRGVPAVGLVSVRSAEEALRLARVPSEGLSASIFTGSRERSAALGARWPARFVMYDTTLAGLGALELACDAQRGWPSAPRFLLGHEERWLPAWPYGSLARWQLAAQSWWRLARRGWTPADGDLL